MAVANALPSVKEHADLVLDEPDGAGVTGLLAGPLLTGRDRVRTSRHEIVIGHYGDQTPVRIPAGQANVLVQGESGTGKSHLAGLLAELWVRAGYSVLVIDIEGDYHGLEHLVDVVVLVGGSPPDAGELVRLLRQGGISVVLDLSLTSEEEATELLHNVAAVIDAERAAWGQPHWVLVDEAHSSLGLGGAMERMVRPGDQGYCLVTYRPDQLPEAITADLDVVITTTGHDARGGHAARIRLGEGPERTFIVSPRSTPHVRHWHKYVGASLPPERCFRFVDAHGAVVASAGNVETFLRCLESVDPAVLDGHLARGDISRWLSACLLDHELAAQAAAVERDVLAQRALGLRRARHRLVSAVESVYGVPGPGPSDEPAT